MRTQPASPSETAWSAQARSFGPTPLFIMPHRLFGGLKLHMLPKRLRVSV